MVRSTNTNVACVFGTEQKMYNHLELRNFHLLQVFGWPGDPPISQWLSPLRAENLNIAAASGRWERSGRLSLFPRWEGKSRTRRFMPQVGAGLNKQRHAPSHLAAESIAAGQMNCERPFRLCHILWCIIKYFC